MVGAPRASVTLLGGFAAEAYRRLVALKDEYDPTNVFRLNQNAAPSA
jgi:FAD/FMN-containing dehydrogenase